MRQANAELSTSLIALENTGRSLEDALDSAQRRQQSALERLDELLQALDEVRAAAGAEAKRAERLWSSLLELADRCFANEQASPPEVRSWLSSLFGELGYSLYGLLGTTVEDSSRYDIVGKSHDRDAQANAIIQVLAVGLLDEDGSVARLAKVVVAA